MLSLKPHSQVPDKTFRRQLMIGLQLFPKALHSMDGFSAAIWYPKKPIQFCQIFLTV